MATNTTVIKVFDVCDLTIRDLWTPQEHHSFTQTHRNMVRNALLSIRAGPPILRKQVAVEALELVDDVEDSTVIQTRKTVEEFTDGFVDAEFFYPSDWEELEDGGSHKKRRRF